MMNIRNAEIADLDALLVLSEQIGTLHFNNAPLVFKNLQLLINLFG